MGHLFTRHLMLVLVNMTLFIVYGFGKGSKSCPKITKSEIDESKYIMDSFRTGEIEEAEPTGMSTYLQGPRSCPGKSDSVSTLCPSYFKLNFDPNRKPMTIVEVICSCVNCLAEKGQQLVNTTHACVPIYYYRDVLEKDSDDCFALKTRRFKVGCECIGGEKRSIMGLTSTG